MRILIYDCEIIKCIPSNAARFSEFEYCEGWDDFENMGISCIGYAWLNSEEAPKVATQLEEFSAIASQADRITGFNSKKFDDNLVHANGLLVTTDWDLLEQVRIAAYGSSDWQDCPKGYSYSLDAIAQANGYAKSGSGALAPQWWQLGRKQEVIEYCANDVAITRALMRLGLAGELRDPNTQEFLKLEAIQ